MLTISLFCFEGESDGEVDSGHLRERECPQQTCIRLNSTEPFRANRFIFSEKLTEMNQFIFHVSWLVTESIHLRKVGN